MSKAHREQILDWFSHPVTIEFLDTIKDRIKDLQESERYRPMITVGDKLVPVTSDFIALQQASIQGQIKALAVVLNSKEEMTNES